ncbi:hypothetical protein A1D22_08710 [Pasteurellaceae bacterium LFhippo2]|nr:hypothetical protein [Pasteurellaceae bacterium LFhippo2]
MNLNDILGSVLGAATNSANQGKADLGSILNTVLNTASQAKSGNTDAISKLGGGTALVGILSMVLGRNGGANLTKLGSLAALGSMAYKAYQSYQSSQSANAGSQQLAESAFESAMQTEDSGVIILRTMIAAAVSDGEIDAAEEQAILQQSGDNPELVKWISNEIATPATPAEIAQMVGNNPALASQVYLAARVVCKDLSRKEIVFLSNLAEELKLNEALVEQLEKQAGF